jgi:uncharacterized delta-60 repeat protein
MTTFPRLLLSALSCSWITGVGAAGLSEPGMLAPSFGSAGRTVIDLVDPGTPEPNDNPVIGRAPDGRLIVAASAGAPGAADGTIGVVSLRANGQRDTDFGGLSDSAVVDIDALPNAQELPDTLRVLSDSRIVLTGNSCLPSTGECRAFATRLTPVGDPDPTYAGPLVDGAAFADLTLGAPAASLVDAAGRVYFALPVARGSESLLLVVRYTAAGLLDTGWNAPTGYVLAAYPLPRPGGFRLKPVYAGGIAAMPDGGIAVCGAANDASDPTMRVLAARFTAAGALHPDFGLRAFPGDPLDASVNSACNGLAARSDGRLILVGALQTRWLILGLGATGALDPAFSGDGRAAHAFFDGCPPFGCRANRVRLDATGRALITGLAQTAGSTRRQTLRLLPGGNLDFGFGFGGEAEPGPPGSTGRDLLLVGNDAVLASTYVQAGDFNVVVEKVLGHPLIADGFE